MSTCSDTDISKLAARLATVDLTGEQQDRLTTIWIEASSDERKMIARLYNKYFVNPNFVQRLQSRVVARAAEDGRNRVPSNRSAVSTSSSGTGLRLRPPAAVAAPATGKRRGGNNSSEISQTQKQRKLRNAIDNAVIKLEGNGPHTIEFGVVNDAAMNQAVIDLYSTQFKYPDPPELARIVTVPRRLSTRTRQKTVGNFTWFIYVHSTREIACAVSVTVHKVDPLTFIEMPLFATNMGYKKLGLARLLNAALQEHCCRIGCDFIMVSADQAAVEFWTNPTIGYVAMPPRVWSRIEFHYTHECKKFNGTELLIWTPPSKDTNSEFHGTNYIPSLIDAAMVKMPRFVLNGPARLPML